jgi:hypothetical protein
MRTGTLWTYAHELTPPPRACTVIQAAVGVPALDEDTVLCFEDKRTLGVVAEIFGPIYEPLYVVRFERYALPRISCNPTNIFFILFAVNFLMFRI